MDENRVVGAATEIGGKLEKAAGDLTGDAKLQAEGTLDGLKGTAQNLAGQAKDAVRGVAGQASDFAQDAYQRGQDLYARREDYIPEAAASSYRDGRRALTEQVQSSPLNALLIAGAIGYGIAWLIHGRS